MHSKKKHTQRRQFRLTMQLTSTQLRVMQDDETIFRLSKDVLIFIRHYVPGELPDSNRTIFTPERIEREQLKWVQVEREARQIKKTLLTQAQFDAIRGNEEMPEQQEGHVTIFVVKAANGA